MSALCGLAAGQVPQLLDYQGRLADGSGDPVADGSYSMVFKLYDDPTAGSQIGTFSETRSVTVTDGLFNVTIGSATGGGIDPNLFNNPAVHLSITVEGEELLPRRQVVSVAYAFGAVHADDADNADLLDGLDSTAFASSGHGHSLGSIATDGQLLNAIKNVDGSGSGLDADLLDGQHGSFYQNASNLNAGTLNNSRFSAYSDLISEERLDNNSTSDLPTRSQADGRYVNVTGDTMTGALDIAGSLHAVTGGLGAIRSGVVEQNVLNSDIAAANNLKADRSLYLGSSKGDGDIHAKDTAGNRTLLFDAGNATLNIGTTNSAGTVAIKSSSNADNILLSGSDGDATFEGTVVANEGLEGHGRSGVFIMPPESSIPATPGVKGVGTTSTFGPGAPGIEAVGGAGIEDIAIRSYGELRFLTHDNDGLRLTPGDGSAAPALSISPYGSTSTSKPLMHLDGDLGFSAGEGLKLEVGDGHLFSVYGSDSTTVDQLCFGGPIYGELLFDWNNATIQLGGSTADTVLIPADIEGGIVVYANSTGYGANDAAVRAEHTHSSGIAFTGRVTSSDACSVFINKGTGGIIKGFSGATGGDLVFEVENNGTVRCREVITTGGDVAEPFDVHDAQAVKPGMVMAIDPERTGGLCIATRPYDRTVAGIVSGANGLNPGLTMKPAGVAGDRSHPVALSGRVWCWCDASDGPIERGDLLTSSDTPGHAMKVTDYDRARGAIMGKAMSPLGKGQGLVLVLVTLQ